MLKLPLAEHCNNTYFLKVLWDDLTASGLSEALHSKIEEAWQNTPINDPHAVRFLLATALLAVQSGHSTFTRTCWQATVCQKNYREDIQNIENTCKQYQWQCSLSSLISLSLAVVKNFNQKKNCSFFIQRLYKGVNKQNVLNIHWLEWVCYIDIIQLELSPYCLEIACTAICIQKVNASCILDCHETSKFLYTDGMAKQNFKWQAWQAWLHIAGHSSHHQAIFFKCLKVFYGYQGDINPMMSAIIACMKHPYSSWLLEHFMFFLYKILSPDDWKDNTIVKKIVEIYNTINALNITLELLSDVTILWNLLDDPSSRYLLKKFVTLIKMVRVMPNSIQLSATFKGSVSFLYYIYHNQHTQPLQIKDWMVFSYLKQSSQPWEPIQYFYKRGVHQCYASVCLTVWQLLSEQERQSDYSTWCDLMVNMLHVVSSDMCDVILNQINFMQLPIITWFLKWCQWIPDDPQECFIITHNIATLGNGLTVEDINLITSPQQAYTALFKNFFTQLFPTVPFVKQKYLLQALVSPHPWLPPHWLSKIRHHLCTHPYQTYQRFYRLSRLASYQERPAEALDDLMLYYLDIIIEQLSLKEITSLFWVGLYVAFSHHSGMLLQLFYTLCKFGLYACSSVNDYLEENHINIIIFHINKTLKYVFSHLCMIDAIQCDMTEFLMVWLIFHCFNFPYANSHHGILFKKINSTIHHLKNINQYNPECKDTSIGLQLHLQWYATLCFLPVKNDDLKWLLSLCDHTTFDAFYVFFLKNMVEKLIDNMLNTALSIEVMLKEMHDMHQRWTQTHSALRVNDVAVSLRP
jgi:hypothetical protein